MDDGGAISNVLDERPELADPMEAVLAVDDEHDEWTFDDVPVDSGAFGELVSRGLVEGTDGGDGYRVARPGDVRVALDEVTNGDTGGTSTAETSRSSQGGTGSGSGSGGTVRDRLDGTAVSDGLDGTVRDRMATLDRATVGSLLGALLAVVLARAYVFGTVFRDGAVVLSGNDPYYYRHWVEQALAASGGVFDVSGLVTLPEAVRTGEPLLVATLWAVSSLFGGDATAAGVVLAWYPVAAAVVSAYLVYRLTLFVTDDRRVALAAVLLLAVTPAHAFRTSLGFADHHAFDYVWLAATAYALVRLEASLDGSDDWRERAAWLWAAGVGVGVSGQVLAWDGGPLMLVPLALYVAVRVLQDVRSERSSLESNAPLVGGLAVGAVVVYLGHALIGWHSGMVTFTPVLLALGAVGVVCLGELAHRFSVPVWGLAVGDGVGALAGLLALRVLRPEYWAELLNGVGRLVEKRNIAETQSLLSGDTFGWLLLFGFILVLAVPVLAWASSRAYHGDRVWFVPVIYCWYFLALAMYQVRFAGQLALFASVFAGFGFVYLASTVDLLNEPVVFADDIQLRATVSLPSWRTTGQLAVLFVLVAGLSFVQVPVKTSQVTTGEDAYRTAAWMDGYADERGWEYPENYVFSQWGESRMYNYFVNGQSRSDGFAQENFGDFAAAVDGEQWYERLHGRTGFIVVRESGQGSTYRQLFEAYGGTTGELSGLSHYRAVYVPDEGTRKVFTLVPGATITGPVPPSVETRSVSTDVRLNGDQFTYERRAEPVAGAYAVTVPYPGNYTVGDRTVRVTEADVTGGATYKLFDGPGVAHWSFDEGQGSLAFDRWGGHNVRVNETRWTSDGVTISGTDSLQTVGDGEFVSVGSDESFTLQFTIQGDLSATPETFPTVFSATGSDDAEIGLWARNDVEDFGVRVTDDEGDQVRLFDVRSTSFASPTNVTVVLDRAAGELRLYRNGSLAGSGNASALGAVSIDGKLLLGGFTSTGDEPVVLSDLRLYHEARDPSADS